MKSLSHTSWMAGMAATGLVMGLGSGAEAAPFLDFESHVAGSDMVGQDGWGPNGAQVMLDALATTDSNAYVGGIAIGHEQTGWGARLGAPGFENATGIRADFYGYTSGATVNLHMWNDISGDGAFQSFNSTTAVYEYGIGFGLDNGGPDFQILETGSEGRGANGMAWSPETWYRLTLTWTGVFDDNGTPSRTFNVVAEDLTNGGMLNGGNPVVSWTGGEDIFSGEMGLSRYKLLDPTRADGILIRASAGLVDNVEIIPEPGTAMLGGLGALMLVGSRRRREV